MKFLWLIWAGLWRRPLRTALMLLSVFTAFLLFGVLQGFMGGLRAAEGRANGLVLVTNDRVSPTEALPLGYIDQIRRVRGVAAISPAGTLPGFYRETSNPNQAFGVDLHP